MWRLKNLLILCGSYANTVESCPRKVLDVDPRNWFVTKVQYTCMIEIKHKTSSVTLEFSYEDRELLKRDFYK